MREIEKDPAAVLDYGFNWSKWLSAGATISSYSFPDLPSGLTVEEDSEAEGIVTVRISGAAVGQSYRLTNEVIASDGQTDRRSIILVGRKR